MSQAVPISSYEDYAEYVARQAHHRAMENYPRFQYSVFLGDSREEQLVVRAEDFEEFSELKAKIAPLLEKPPVRKAANGNSVVKAANFNCEVCGSAAEYREGVSKRTKKPYKGVFCTSKDCDYARFW